MTTYARCIVLWRLYIAEEITAAEMFAELDGMEDRQGRLFS